MSAHNPACSLVVEAIRKAQDAAAKHAGAETAAERSVYSNATKLYMAAPSRATPSGRLDAIRTADHLIAKLTGARPV